MNIIITILSILITLMVVVGLHEFGHFIMARSLNVKVIRFSIGFGRIIFKRTDQQGTEYVFALIPLGGYVKMLNTVEDKVSESDLSKAYDKQAIWKKLLIILAGPLTNFITAFILYYIIFLMGFTTVKPIIGTIENKSIAAQANLQANQQIISIDGHQTRTWNGVLLRLLAHAGLKDTVQFATINQRQKEMIQHQLDLSTWEMNELKPDPLTSLGITPYTPTGPFTINKINKNSPAKNILKKGDKVIAVQNQHLIRFSQLINFIEKNPSRTLNFTIIRNGVEQKVNIPITIKQPWIIFPTGYLGISFNIDWPPHHKLIIKHNVIYAIPAALNEIKTLIYFNLLILGKMLTGKLSLHSLGGPILIFQSAQNAFHYGLIAFFSFLAFFSIAVGIINLLPIPGLDGGHLAIQIIEAIIRRTIPDTILINAYRIGFSILFAILMVAIVNDLLRL